MMFQRIVFTLLLSIGLFTWAQAQSFYDWRIERSSSISVFMGSASYFGELNFDDNVNADISSAGIGYHRFIAGRLSARVEALWFQIDGADSNAPSNAGARNRNLSFRANNVELHVAAQIGLLPPVGKAYYDRRQFDIYLLLGGGATYYNPQAELDGVYYNLRDIQTEGEEYGSITPIAIFGGGFEFKLNYIMNLHIEAAFRYTWTDRLDDVSTTYVDPSFFGGANTIGARLADRSQEVNPDRPPRAAGRPRGNPDIDDLYFIGGVRLEIYVPADVFQKRGGRRSKIKWFRKTRRSPFGR